MNECRHFSSVLAFTVRRWPTAKMGTFSPLFFSWNVRHVDHLPTPSGVDAAIGFFLTKPLWCPFTSPMKYMPRSSSAYAVCHEAKNASP